MTRRRWAWGVDVSTTRIAIGAIADDGAWWTMHRDIEEKGARADGVRLAALWSLTRAMASEQPPHLRPDVVIVENPMTRHNHFYLVASAGVAIHALHSTLYRPVLELGIQKWKKEVVGNGNASKEAITAFAAEVGYLGSVQDEADALCIAHAGLTRFPS